MIHELVGGDDRIKIDVEPKRVIFGQLIDDRNAGAGQRFVDGFELIDVVFRLRDQLQNLFLSDLAPFPASLDELLQRMDRLGGGDLNALVGLIGFTGGILLGNMLMSLLSGGGEAQAAPAPAETPADSPWTNPAAAAEKQYGTQPEEMEKTGWDDSGYADAGGDSGGSEEW